MRVEDVPSGTLVKFFEPRLEKAVDVKPHNDTQTVTISESIRVQKLFKIQCDQ